MTRYGSAVIELSELISKALCSVIVHFNIPFQLRDVPIQIKLLRHYAWLWCHLS